MILWFTRLRNSLLIIWFNAWLRNAFYQLTKTIFGLLDRQIPNRICLLDRTHSLHNSEKQKRNPSEFWGGVYIQDSENATPTQMKTALFIPKDNRELQIKTLSWRILLQGVKVLKGANAPVQQVGENEH